MENTFQNYRQIWGIGTELYEGTDPNEIALTFDDGPNEPHTLQLLEILSQYGALATFFMVGKYVRKRPDIVRAVQKAGHIIGNHTDQHRDLTTLSPEAVKQELQGCQKALEDATGISPRVFRPPFGRNSTFVDRVAKQFELSSVIWSVIPEDYACITVERIVNRVCMAIDSIKKWEIVLLHDGDGDHGFGADRQRTVDATRHLLQHYSRVRKRFVSILGLSIQVDDA